MNKKIKLTKNVTLLVVYLFIVWGLYRQLFKLPEEIEEVLIKPVVWLLPVIYLVRKEKKGLKSLGITSVNLFPSVYFAIGIGILLTIEGFFVNFFKYEKSINFSANLGSSGFLLALALSFATAVSEEITFRGYIFDRVWKATGNEMKANLLTSFVWALIHVPVALFWWELSLRGTFGFLLLTLIFGISSAYIYARTKNIFAPILLHVFWEWPILLFR